MLVKGSVGALISRCVVAVRAGLVTVVGWVALVSRAGLTHVDALVVLAVVFALAGREGPGVLLDAQSCCENLATSIGLLPPRPFHGTAVLQPPPWEAIVWVALGWLRRRGHLGGSDGLALRR